MSRRLVIAVAAVALLASAGCKRRERSVSTTSNTASESASDKTSAGSEARRALESHLRDGKAWGNDATATRVAESILADELIASRNEMAVAAQLDGASPRRLVVVVRLKYLKEESGRDRQAIVDLVKEAIGQHVDDRDEVTLGIRGPIAYGVVASGRANGAWSVKTGKILDAKPLEQALLRMGTPK